MRIYSIKKFMLFLSISCAVGLAVSSFTSWGLDFMIPIHATKFYQQLVNYENGAGGKPMPDVLINHTIVVLEGTPAVESILLVTRTGDYNPDVEVEINFSAQFLAPRLVEGNLTWAGQIYVNQTETIYSKFAFDTDGTYFICSFATAYLPSSGPDKGSMGIEGSISRYYFVVQEGEITQVLDGNNQMLDPYMQSIKR